MAFGQGFCHVILIRNTTRVILIIFEHVEKESKLGHQVNSPWGYRYMLLLSVVGEVPAPKFSFGYRSP